MSSQFQISNFKFRKVGIVLLLLAAGLLMSAAIGRPDGPDHTRTFVEASAAYDNNRLPDAIAGWEKLLDEGQVLPEVLFNLGNAYYRNGQLGPAIRAYRQAERLAPRDPDIRANLGFAAQTAGITLPVLHPVTGRLLDVSRAEWMKAAGLLYGLLFLSLAVWIVQPRFRSVLRPLSGGLLLLLLMAMAGLWAQHNLRAVPECVVMKPDQTVRSGPLESATPILALPEGAIVRKLDEHSDWAEVQTEGTRGWLPADVISPVL